jgi:hypothetical protein
VTYRTRAAGARIPAALKKQTKFTGGPIVSPPAREVNQIKTCSSWRCAAPATIAHVARFGGNQERLCLRHLQEAERQELVERVRGELARIFRCPRPFRISGGAIAAGREAACG